MAGGVAAEPPPARAGAVTAERWALAGLLALALALRLVDLGDGLWYDEIVTLVNYVRRPLGDIVTTYDSQNQHLLYSIMARVSVSAFGESAWALRLPAALAGVLSLWAVVAFGRRVVSAREALLAALLLAVSYHHVWFSQNARGYTMLLAGTLAGTAALLALMEPDQAGAARRRVAAFALVTALTLYTHVTAAFVVAAQGLVWLTLVAAGRTDRPSRGRVLTAFAAAGVLALLVYLPVLSQFVTTLTRPTMAGVAVEWKNPLWLVAETARGLSQGVPGGWPVLVAGVVVFGTGVASCALRAPAALGLMVLPVVLTAAAMLATAHNLWPRLFFFAAGFAALIVVRGGFAVSERLLPRNGRALATAGCLLAAFASAVTVPRAWAPKQDYAGAAAYLAAQAGPRDGVAVVDMTRFPYQRWLGETWPAVTTAADLAALEAASERTWVLTTMPTRLAAVAPDVWATLQRSYREAARFPGTLGGGAIIVMVNR